MNETQKTRWDRVQNEGATDGFDPFEEVDWEEEELREFLAEWTPEVTAARREQWNETASRPGITLAEVERRVGFRRLDLQVAVGYYNEEEDE